MGQKMRGQDNTWLRTNRIPQALRSRATDAERLLWRYLRGQQLGVKFRRQHPFNNYVLDFVCLERKLVVELDGGQHLEDVVNDGARTRELSIAGFRVLRFWNNQVFQETAAVVETIMAALAETHPHPNPPLEGEGVKGFRNLGLLQDLASIDIAEDFSITEAELFNPLHGEGADETAP